MDTNKPTPSGGVPEKPKNVFDEYDAMLPSAEQMKNEAENRPFNEITLIDLEIPDHMVFPETIDDRTTKAPSDDEIIEAARNRPATEVTVMGLRLPIGFKFPDGRVIDK